MVRENREPLNDPVLKMQMDLEDAYKRSNYFRMSAILREISKALEKNPNCLDVSQVIQCTVICDNVTKVLNMYQETLDDAYKNVIDSGNVFDEVLTGER